MNENEYTETSLKCVFEEGLSNNTLVFECNEQKEQTQQLSFSEQHSNFEKVNKSSICSANSTQMKDEITEEFANEKLYSKLSKLTDGSHEDFPKPLSNKNTLFNLPKSYIERVKSCFMDTPGKNKSIFKMLIIFLVNLKFIYFLLN